MIPEHDDGGVEQIDSKNSQLATDGVIQSTQASEADPVAEQRFRTYQDKVLSAITYSAKKKQQEQKDLMRQIELENQLKRGQKGNYDNSQNKDY